MTLKSRFLLVTVITTLLVTLAVIMANQLMHHRQELRFLQSTIDGKRAFWNHLLTNTLDRLQANIFSITRDQATMSALAADDTAKLRETIESTYNRLAIFGSVTKLQLVDEHGKVLLSLPDNYSGVTAKGVVKAALTEGKIVGGIERDDDGELVAVVSTPLYIKHGELIGAAVFERDMRDALQPFMAHDRSIAYIVDQAGIVGRAVKPAMFLAASEIMPKLGEDAYSIERFYDRVYQVAVLSINDYLGHPLAHLVTVNDFTDSYEEESRVSYIAYAIISLVLLLSLLCLYWFVVMESARLHTEDQRRNRELKLANAKLQEALRVKSDFLANMSHELRTPLNAIIGFSAALLEGIDGALNDEQRTSIGHVNASGEHLLRLINDVLDLSKIEAGRMVLNLETVDLASLVESTMYSIEVLFRRKSLVLRHEIRDRIPVIYGDNTRIKQVLLNVLSNAAKFTDKGEVVVQCRTVKVDDPVIPQELREHMPYQTHWILVAIADTGMGIRKADQLKVFEEFRQIDSGSTRKYRGTGLGMAISKRIVQMHGGEMWLESEVGRGTTFYFTLPLHFFERESALEEEDYENPMPVDSAPTPDQNIFREDRVAAKRKRA